MSDFREKIQDEIKKVKRDLYKEELKSFAFSVIFGMNVACIVVTSFSFVMLLNALVIYWMSRSFKPTVKQQIMFHQILKSLKTMKDEKVWTQQD